ncbi:uncharacterized protein LY89DRAFT_683040 [Mollisia scopiformis]|uniref:Uncharacterized protein n=1 Tax=Mollisia scopiformis TaxID=149040 RepID=A0A194XFZ9_MOLSC|nr:uncharacterized protein LY89DRAFT_683040 [Mollisia scopiformis]KUJ19098.1 hypothetical protein LY89DRAFT_683040 [Mollisia scopiformis]
MLFPVCRRYNYLFTTFLCQFWIWGLALDFPDDPSRIPRYDMEFWNILRDHTSGTHSTTSTYRNARANGHITTEPAILPNSDRFPQLRTLNTIPEERIQRMSGGEERAIGTKESPCSYRYQTSVQESAIEVDINSFAKSRNHEQKWDGIVILDKNLKLVP